jgi:hypothetical protein
MPKRFQEDIPTESANEIAEAKWKIKNSIPASNKKKEL